MSENNQQPDQQPVEKENTNNKVFDWSAVQTELKGKAPSSTVINAVMPTTPTVQDELQNLMRDSRSAAVQILTAEGLVKTTKDNDGFGVRRMQLALMNLENKDFDDVGSLAAMYHFGELTGMTMTDIAKVSDEKLKGSPTIYAVGDTAKRPVKAVTEKLQESPLGKASVVKIDDQTQTVDLAFTPPKTGDGESGLKVSRGVSVVLTDAPVSTEDGRCISDRLFSKHFGRTEETPELGSADGWVMISRALASKHSGVTGITSLLDAQVESHEIPKRVFREVPIRAIGESEARSPRLMIKRRSLSTTGLIKLVIEQRKHSNIFDVRNPVRYLAVNPNNLRNTLRSAKASGVGVAFVHQTVYYNKITQRWDLY